MGFSLPSKTDLTEENILMPGDGMNVIVGGTVTFSIGGRVALHGHPALWLYADF